MSPSCSRARTPRRRSPEASARRAALDAALAELDAGRDRAVGRVAPRVLAHARPRAPALRGGAAPGRRDHALGPPGRRPLGHADRARGGAADRPQRQRARGRGGATSCHTGEVELEGDELPDEEPLDWDPAEEAEEEAAADAQEEDPGAARRFWFEHATGAGKTVAALGFVEASRTGGILILTHRRNLVDQFLGELRDRGYKKRIIRAAAEERQRRAARRRAGHGRDLPVVRAQRRQGLGRVHDRHLRRGAHRARREDERVDPPVDRARCSSA